MRKPALIAFVCAALLATGCSASSGTVYSGRVVDDTVALSAPPLPVPSPALSVTPSARSRVSTVAAMTGLGATVRVIRVVRVGDAVSAGQVVAELDGTALAAAVDVAVAAEKAARAQIGVLDARLGDVADARSTIARTRTDVRAAIAKLVRTRADLQSKLGEVRDQRAQLQRILDSLPQRPPGGVPPTRTVPPGAGVPPTGTLPPGGIPDPAKLRAALAKLDAAIVKIKSGLAKLDAGLVKARAGLRKLETASATTYDARSTLLGVRDVARVAIDLRSAAVELARIQRDLTVVRTPVAGVVVSAVQPGEAAAVGAPLVVVRPTSAAEVEIYLAPERVSGLARGDAVRVTTDSDGGASYSAKIAVIGVRAAYPPSWVSTTDVHMTRARVVRVTLDDPGVWLAPGTPADVQIASAGSTK